jgi:Ca-activated chloride channel family protein
LLASGVLVPILLWVYLRLQRASAAAPAGFKAKWLSHAPLILVLLGLTCLGLALARPQAVMLTPMREATVMLAMDISGSMRAKDLEPSRFEAAKAAAERFIEDKPARLRVGLVTIAGTAALAQAPTDQRDDLLRALENLPLQYGSALGTGVLISLEALLPGANIDAQKIINEAMDGKPAKPPTQPVPSQPAPSTNPVPQGRSMAIVLLSDGQGNMGPDLLAMAKLAAEHKVRIYTVGVGTPEGAIVQAQGRSMRVRLEEDMLHKVAAETQGEYFRASSAQDLHKIYDMLGHRFRFEKRAVTEVTGAMAALGMLLALWGCLLSLHRYGRIL